MEKQITLEEAKDIIFGTNGSMFSVTFKKRTTGEIRELNGRLGVKKGIKGIGLAFDPYIKGLIPVYDMKKKDFRTIDANAIISLKANGERYTVITH